MLAIAHRAPSTPAGCARLAALGVKVFEIDVQVVDGELVVSHFLPVVGAVPRLRRDRWTVTLARRQASEIALAGAVAAIPKDVAVLLDLKTDRGEPALELARLVAAAGLEPKRCHVSSKGWESLAILRKKGFRTWRSVADARALAAAVREGRVADHAYTVRHTLLNPQITAGLHTLAPHVMAWTVNSQQRAMRLADFGVDGITSDDPDVLAWAAALPPRGPRDG